MKRLTIFPLNTVIRYADSQVRNLLFEVIGQQLELQFSDDPLPKESNHHKIALSLFQSHLERDPNQEELEAMKKAMKKAVKKLYLDDEDAFEVRPGVQSLFSQFAKEKAWKYGIISELWEEPTQFILQSCGVSSKDKLTVCAESADSLPKQIKVLTERANKEGAPKIQLVRLKKSKYAWEDNYKIIRPKASDKESNYYVFPKFNELFKGKKKVKKKDTSK